MDFAEAMHEIETSEGVSAEELPAIEDGLLGSPAVQSDEGGS